MQLLVPDHLPRHLANDELMPSTPGCPFCSSKSRTPVATLQEAPEVVLLKCDDCRAASVSRFPTREALDKYYQEDFYRVSHSKSHQQQITFDNPERFGKHLARRVTRRLRSPLLRLLDFGGGDGALALATARQLLINGVDQVEVTIVDYNDERLVASNDKRISVAKFRALDQIQELRYDLIIASAVVEHLPEPRQILIRLLNLVDKGGLFYARTPNVTSFMKLFRMAGIKWEFFFPAHLHDLGQAFWETFFSSNGFSGHFTIVESRPSVVETSFNDHFMRTLASVMCKAPWFLFGSWYTLVGGWEILVRRGAERES